MDDLRLFYGLSTVAVCGSGEIGAKTSRKTVGSRVRFSGRRMGWETKREYGEVQENQSEVESRCVVRGVVRGVVSCGGENGMEIESDNTNRNGAGSLWVR